MRDHKCYFDEMDFNYETNKWVCSVCGNPYVPPQRRDVLKEEWMPWKIPVPKIYIWRFAEMWRPWRDYALRSSR